MVHKIIIMHDKEEHSGGLPTGRTATNRHDEALQAAALQMAVIAPRFFKAVKSMMVYNLELPNEVREMGESQVMVLRTLTKGRQLTSDLAKHFNVTNPTMTRVVDALVDKGYVERQHAMDDRRCIYLQLTGQGQDMSKRVERHFHDAIIQFLSPLSEEQLNDIVRAYSHLDSLLPATNLEAEAEYSEDDRRARRAGRMNRQEGMHHRHSRRHGHPNEKSWSV